ncbi:MAG TPA: hypothetical protein VE077_20545 [Candidatus Methylomirabilis sp.]|nr:hypothetical protein [Candidatus Methylomirabilis sp.]
MSIRLILTFACLFLTDADIPRINNFRAPAKPVVVFPSGEEISLFPDTVTDAGSGQGGSQAPAKPKSATLQESSKLELIRFVSGEFARATKSLPAGKDGFTLYVGKPLQSEFLERALATHGAAVNSGDQVQITKLDFRSQEIIVDLNGGGRGKKRLRDRIHIEMGGIPTMQTTTEQEQTGPPGIQPGMGSTLYLEFNNAVPDLGPNDLKQILSPFLDFSGRSASVQWIDTLPPETKKAIQERRPLVGMDREEVVAAMGKPDHKVRERDAQGNDIEDWIYGQPPSKTIFVRFSGDHVTRIKQYPD